LREKCLGGSETRAAYEAAKEEGRNEENPGVRKCLNILGYQEGSQVFCLCTEIANVAGFVLHHRQEKLVTDQGIRTKFKDLLSEKAIDILSDHKESLRYESERDKAKESLSNLYRLLETGALS